ncbi:GatB/YqeY domain-containing protein [Motiliproteus sp. MSK22-1]|uniref:GatB/YqeY domain-containing protein n=1 Tax=Motiliproteus sp. MSK22-1 TaxID=1897630 RepID=UPI0009756167|nr:GatB/YqeY domain-containing protein [Motiliproteus sp. MSK22-1]OMH32146.1 glutamyl-tRNA amidotransferase [Motiliproteus sp. MSK22-1]
MSDESLKDKIKAAQKEAMRARDKERLGAVRLILAEVKRIEVDERIELDDTRILAILDKMQKQRRDSIAQFDAAGRDDLSEVERKELEVIKSFLPAQLTDQEIDQLIDQAVSKTGADSMQAMGSVMGILKPQIQGRADMGIVSKKIKARLS